jgi:hypothetical protein
MVPYRLEPDSDGDLAIYHRTAGSQPDLWIGDILEPDSPNPMLALGTPVGILGVRRILALFEKWKAEDHPTSGKRQTSTRSSKCPLPSRKWRKVNRAGK